jgi:hypothetical protein
MDNLIKGGLTKTGKQTYKYYNKSGKIIEVLPETAENKKYKPVLKGNYDDSKLKTVDLDKTNESKSIQDLDELEKIRKEEIERIRKKKEERNKNKVLDKSKNIVELLSDDEKYSEVDKSKMKQLLEKREKIEQERLELNNKIKEKKELKNKLSEDRERLLKIKEKQEQQKSESIKEINNVNELTNIKNKVDEIKEEKGKSFVEKQDRISKNLQSKDSIVDKMFDNPIAEILKKYLIKNDDFQIFHAGKLIYNSKNTSKDKLHLNENNFELFGKHYPYSGLRFKKI